MFCLGSFNCGGWKGCPSISLMYITLTRDAIHENKYIENINCGILDAAGEFDTMKDTNAAAANLGQGK